MDLTSEHLELARSTARAFHHRLPKGIGLNLCDLESAANYGLVQASICYEDSVCCFERYAEIRIRGSILDYLRSLNPIGCKKHRRIQVLNAAVGKEALSPSIKMNSFSAKEINPEQLAMRQQEIDRIRAVTRLLSNREQSLLKMRYDDDLSLGEIAHCLQITQGRVSQLQQRTHHRLRHLLATSRQSLRQSLVRHLRACVS